jgi:HEAT repeat protein
MRERVKAKIWKRLRRLRGDDALLRSVVERKMKCGASLTEALQAIVLDRGSPPERAAAAELLPPPVRQSCLMTLARRLAEDVEDDDLLPIANVFRFLHDPVGVPFFVTALTDPHPQRRYAAAYALGIPVPASGPSRC